MAEKLYDFQRHAVSTEEIQKIVDDIGKKGEELLKTDRETPEQLRALHDYRGDIHLLYAFRLGILVGAGFKEAKITMLTGETYDFTPSNNGAEESLSAPGGLADRVRSEARPEDFNI